MKRVWPLLIVVSFGLFIAAFTPPGKDEQRKAVGSLLHLSPELRAAFTPGDDFAPIPKPDSWDWVATHDEPGQTFDQYLKSRPQRVGTRGRKFIYLQPIGKFPEKAPKMETLKKHLEAYFHPVPVKLLQPVILKPSPRIKTRGDQVNCTDLLNVLQTWVPKDACVLMAVTMKDLYPGPEWNFVFGVARLKRRCGVFSFARYGVEEDQKLALMRALKVISHETGHAFGIKHCIHFHCLMNGSNGLEETDWAPLHFCPACLRKLHWALRFSPSARYQKLATFLQGNDFEKESEWFTNRIEVIEKSKER
jgi:archaemetzincin